MDIKKIAKESGVSIATVSRILNNKDCVAPETREKVLKVIEKYEFVPNRIAKSFVQRKTFTIGITPTHSSPPAFADTFFPVLISGMEDALSKEGYNLLFLYARGYELQQKNYFVNLFKGRHIDGLILLNIKKDNPAFNLLEQTEFPYVSIGKICDRQKGSYVDTDNVKRTYIAVEHFIKEHGFTKIGYIGLKPEYSVYADAIDGYNLCHIRHDLKINKDLLYLAKAEDMEEGYKGIKKLLEASPECLVIFGNILLYGIMEYISEKKIKIPEDIPIIHCSELPPVSPFGLSIAQVKQPVFEMGRYAIDILFRHIKDKKKAEQIVLSPSFSSGDSCGCITQKREENEKDR